jgi:hypothetical protein
MYRALQQHLERLVQRQQALSFVTVLPALNPVTATQSAQRTTPAPAPPARKPTHLLQDHTAIPLADAGTALGGGWELFYTAAGWQLRGAGGPVMVNNATYREGQIVANGDTINIGSAAPVRLIEVRT